MCSSDLGMTQYSIPIFGTILSVAILGENIHTYHLVGIAVIFTGIWLVTSGRRKTAPQSAQTTTTRELGS